MTDARSLEYFARLFDLSGRRAVVIGGGSGIGEAGVLGLSAFGAAVVVADAKPSAADSVVTAVRSGGGSASAVPVQLMDRNAPRMLLDTVGVPDILVLTPATNVRKRIIDTTDEEVERVIDLNLTATYRVLREFGRAMSERGSGSIIALSSIRSQVVEPGQGVYAATKAGIVQLVKTLASEVGTMGVRVNAILPGVVDTPLTSQIKADAAWYGAYASKSILQRWAAPSELAGAIVFLASDASSYVTGSSLVVDGGWLAADGRFDPPM